MSLTPEELYIALSNMIVDICGGHAPVRKEPITLEEWQELRLRWDLICSVNIPRIKQ
jgi:hypothetical protein